MKRSAAEAFSRDPSNKRVAVEAQPTIVIAPAGQGQGQVINITGVNGGVIHIHNA